MDDLIRRQDAIDKIKDWMKFLGYSHSERNVMECTIQMLEELPSAQKTGKWIHKREYDLYPYDILTCSVCGETDARMYRSDEYCPHCGARMVGEEE